MSGLALLWSAAPEAAAERLSTTACMLPADHMVPCEKTVVAERMTVSRVRRCVHWKPKILSRHQLFILAGVNSITW